MINTVLKSIILIAITSMFFSCSSEPKIPVWEISKEGTPTSYLMENSNYLTKEDVDIMLSNKIIRLFDSCSTYISFWDLKNSSLTEAKQWIEIGNNKTLKDTLSPELFSLLKTKTSELGIAIQSPDSVNIKPQFYLNDILNANGTQYFNTEQFFFKRALPQQKEMLGVETFQNYYKTYSSLNFEEAISVLDKHSSIHKGKEEANTSSNEYYKNEEYSKLLQLNEKSIKNIGLNPDYILKENGNDWTNIINKSIQTEKTFILLDINYTSLENKNSLHHKLLSKGYNLKRIN